MVYKLADEAIGYPCGRKGGCRRRLSIISDSEGAFSLCDKRVYAVFCIKSSTCLLPLHGFLTFVCCCDPASLTLKLGCMHENGVGSI